MKCKICGKEIKDNKGGRFLLAQTNSNGDFTLNDIITNVLWLHYDCFNEWFGLLDKKLEGENNE